MRSRFEVFGVSRGGAVPIWALGLAAFALAGMALVTFVVGITLFLIAAPFALGLFLYGRWRLRRFLQELRPVRGPADGRVIEAEYKVIDSGSDPRR